MTPKPRLKEQLEAARLVELDRLRREAEATDKLLREIQRALWHAGFGRGQSELDGLFAALGAELGPYPPDSNQEREPS